MKTLIKLSLLCSFTFLLASATQAQSSVKDMDKKTKSELKEYIKNPSSYRKMIGNYNDQVEDYELQVTELQEDYYKADYLRVLYYDSIQELNYQLKNMSNPMAMNQEGVLVAEGSGSGTNMYKNTGTDFRVQIGAYRLFDFTQLLKFNQPIGFEKVNDVIHYYLGSWGNANDAYSFAEAIRKLNIKDAFVSKYVDGKRVPYDHLMEGGGTAFNQ